MSRRRLLFLIVGGLAVSSAVMLWLSDGAWHYGAMPTKGVIRTFLFGGCGCILLCVAEWLARNR